jgi:hypothetical protein
VTRRFQDQLRTTDLNDMSLMAVNAFPTNCIKWMFTLVRRRLTMQRSVAPIHCPVCGRLARFVIKRLANST